MKINPKFKSRAFTLVELLVAMAIVTILAAMSFGGYKWASSKQAEKKAEVQISLLSNAIEDYKFENGTYPIGNGSTNVLFMALWGNGSANPTSSKIYLTELDPDNNKQGWIEGSGASARIVDPWGEEFIYNAPGIFNPDFDIISKGRNKITSPNRANLENKDDFTN